MISHPTSLSNINNDTLLLQVLVVEQIFTSEYGNPVNEDCDKESVHQYRWPLFRVQKQWEHKCPVMVMNMDVNIRIGRSNESNMIHYHSQKCTICIDPPFFNSPNVIQVVQYYIAVCHCHEDANWDERPIHRVPHLNGKRSGAYLKYKWVKEYEPADPQKENLAHSLCDIPENVKDSSSQT